MNMRLKFLYLGGVLLTLSTSGCIVINGGGCSWGTGSSVWTEATEQRSIDTAGLTALQVRTHNGEIRFDGQPAGSGPGVVTITKKAGGITMADAEAAIAALDAFVEPIGDGTLRIGWRWKGIRRSTWNADVSYAITAPESLRLDAETHNGVVEAANAANDVRLVTHNGRIKVASRNGELHAETHNGAINATYEGDALTLITHNGSITADLSRCGSVRGDVATHNGAVELIVGEQTSADLNCDTHNGRISFDTPITVSKSGRTTLEGRLGAGGQPLDIVTHNGSIRIKNTAG